MDNDLDLTRVAALPQPRRATLDDAGPLARLLASAFHDDPVSEWVRPGGTSLAEVEAYFRTVLHERAIPLGQVWMNPDGSACAVLLPPGAPSEPSKFAGQSIALLLDPASLDAEQLARAAAIGKAMDASHPREPHYYLPFIAVANERRGEGRGSALLRALLKRIDDERAPAYLENSDPRNTSFYERAGFVARGDIAPEGAPPLVVMCRPARA